MYSKEGEAVQMKAEELMWEGGRGEQEALTMAQEETYTGSAKTGGGETTGETGGACSGGRRKGGGYIGEKSGGGGSGGRHIGDGEIYG